MDTFKESYKELNEGQKKAVDAIFGPVMVIAGPGTGKTQILSVRIANILQKTDTDPRNILCLTYTDAGVIAMRKRLEEIIGTVAYNVNIYTFHSFCNQIIQDNQALFGEQKEQSAIDDLERFDLFVDMMNKWPVGHPLKRLKGDFYFDRNRLANLFSTMKQESWTSEFIKESADRYIAEIPLLEEFQYKRGNKKTGVVIGDLKQGLVDKEIDKMVKLKAAADAFTEYNTYMKQIGRYDYHDMISWVTTKMNSDADFLATLQERYQFILVDEYQDTNGAQNELLFLLSGEVEDKPNVFVVGDEEQSIYRFQGAILNNLLDFNRRFTDDIQLVILEDNYRSGNDILLAARKMIEENKESLGIIDEKLKKKLIPAGKNKNYHDALKVSQLFSVEQEYVHLVNYIETLLEKGVQASDIAIIYRKHKDAIPLAKYFRQRGIKFSMKLKTDLLKIPFIQKIIQILDYIDQENKRPFSGNQLLFDIMLFDIFQLSTVDVGIVSRKIYSDKNIYWRSIISDELQLAELNLSHPDKILSFSRLLESWISIHKNDTIQSLFEHIIYSEPLLKALHPETNYDFETLNHVRSLFNFIKDQTLKKSNLSLSELIDILLKMKQNEIRLASTNTKKTGDGVQFLTAHSSKGLEFDYVIMTSANQKNWEDSRNANNGFSFPPSIVPSNPENKIEDNRRLFYVAMTRARKELFLSFADADVNGKNISPSRFISELKEANTNKPFPKNITEEALSSFMISQFAPFTKIKEDQILPNLDEILESVTLNISAVNKYLKCPVSYYYENILRSPVAHTAFMGYGNAVHYALENLFKVDNGQLTIGSVEEFIQLFKNGMDKYNSHFTIIESENYFENGKISLVEYYNSMITEWQSIPKSSNEHKVQNVTVAGVPVTGIFDRLDIYENKYVVTDYKTGKVTTAKKKIKAPQKPEENYELYKSEKNPEKKDGFRIKFMGDDYWRQLVFYKLLVDADSSLKKDQLVCQISLVEASDDKAFYNKRLDITPEEMDIVKNQVRYVYDKIKSKKFEAGCNLPHCRWCTLHASNNINSEE